MLLAGVFASLVFLNYVVQSTFLPHLARHRSPADDPLIGALAMANPTSLAWALRYRCSYGTVVRLRSASTSVHSARQFSRSSAGNFSSTLGSRSPAKSGSVRHCGCGR